MKRASIHLLLLCTLSFAGCEDETEPSRDGDQQGDDGGGDASSSAADVSDASARLDGAAQSDAAAREEGGASRTDAGAVSHDAAVGDPNVRVGEFSLQLIEASGDNEAFTSLLGRVADGPVPEMLVWEKKSEANGCTLLTPRVPFCEQGCGAAVCTADDTCRPNPKAHNAGKVTVRGVRTTTGATEFSVEPINNSYQAVGVSLPYPAFDEGDPIELAAEGGEVGAFTLKGRGIAPLELTGRKEGYPLERGKGIDLAWKPAASGGNTRVQVKLDISHHGGTRGKIECDVADSGALTIPASLTDALTDLGTAGFPTIVVTRSAVTSTTTRLGRVDLRVYMYVESDVHIPGLISCDGNADCPMGQTCEARKCS